MVEVVGGHDPDALVELGSLTKTVTATAVEVLSAAGRLDLDAPLDVHLPVPRGTGITAALLLRHRSGLPRLGLGVRGWGSDPYRHYTAQHLAGVLAALPQVVRHPPDTVEEYSNLGYAVLGELVARVCGQDWYDAVRDLVLEPAGTPDLVLVTEQRRTLVGAGRTGRARRPWTLGAMAPAGGLWGTPRAAARWLHAVLVEERFGPAAGQHGPVWARTGPALWHNGATRDASVLAAALPGTGLYVLVHALGRPHDETDAHGLRLLAAQRDQQPGG